MSLLILSSSQDKYSSSGFQQSGDADMLTTNAIGGGIQNPASFTNNINPVVKIPKNSQVALKSASYFRPKNFVIGGNTSFSFYFGELLRSRFSLEANLSLDETTNYPIPIPITAGVYNERTLANEITAQLDQYISHPDLIKNAWIEPADEMGDTGNTKGFIFNFQQGDSDTLTDAVAELQTESEIEAWTSNTNDFTWTIGTVTYSGTATTVPRNNFGILNTAPISQKGGVMTWDVSSAPTGWFIGLTRPTANDEGRRAPYYWISGGDTNRFFDYAVRYDGETFYMYHAVERDGVYAMREIQYYNNTDAHFTPRLSSYNTGGVKHNLPMYSASRWTNTAAAAEGTDPSTPASISFTVSGEDITIEYTDNNADDWVLTDTRLCIEGNANATAQTPTRNLFPKPTGLTTHALYPKVGGLTGTETLTLSLYNAVHKDGSIFEDGNNANGSFYKYPETTVTGEFGASAGDSFWGRSQFGGRMKTGQIAQLVDFAKPYQSDLTTAQKQYVGLGGPNGATPPVREGEGNPYIPATAVEDGLGIAYTRGLVLVPSAASVSSNNIKGVYCSETSDVSSMLGFPDKTVLFSNLAMGSSYLFADELDETSTSAPTDTAGAFFGFYVGSDVEPEYTQGELFVRIPQLTHQTQNFGKGIPSKIIGQLPSSVGQSVGQIYYEPNNLTYFDLNNAEELNVNVLTCEIVDKTEQVLQHSLGKSTTIQLHIKQK